MRQSIAHALLLTIWIGLIGLITWLDLHNAFLFFAQPNPLLIFPTYLIAVVVLVGIPFLPLLLFWRRGLPYGLRIPVLIGVVWLLTLPFIPWTSQKALIMDAARLRVGMTSAQVRAIMATHQGVHTRDGRRFCADGDWKNDTCNGYGTVIDVRMERDQLVAVDIDMD